MLRETTFLVGGAALVGLGVLLGYGLYAAGVGVEYLGAWLAVPLAFVFGGFFVHVARAERRERLSFLRSAEGPPTSPGRGR